ncbi:MAG: DinB family protein [Kineosporiaceae bacterium]
MTDDDVEQHVRHYLDAARDALLWKLEGLSEHDARRPLTPTGTNLLGLVKHAAWVQAGYFGVVFGRPFPDEAPWEDPAADEMADMWATADESRADIVDLHRRVRSHADATLAALPLDTVGLVPWWREGRNRPTLHRICLHVIAEIHRHAGHADIVRELVDGAVGMVRGNENLPSDDPGWWSRHRHRVEAAARDAQAASARTAP